MTGPIRIFEKLNFTPKLSVLVSLKVKLPNMTDWHIEENTHPSRLKVRNLELFLDGAVLDLSES